MKNWPIIILLSFSVTFLLTLTALRKSENPKTLMQDTLQANRDMYKQRVLASIKGKEKLPADSVFENIEILNGMPAGSLLAIMDVAYSQSLGVSCGHCHNTENFASEEKPEKQIAREMWKFAAQTRELLKNVKGLKSENPTINCTTCHRGQVKPTLNLN